MEKIDAQDNVEEKKNKNKEVLGDFCSKLYKEANVSFWTHSLCRQITHILEDEKNCYVEYLTPKDLRRVFEYLANSLSENEAKEEYLQGAK